MDILGLLIPAALFLGLLGLVAFVWALKSGQFDDLDGAAMRILIDDETKNIQCKIYVDMVFGSNSNGRILDVVALWRAIHDNSYQIYPSLAWPIETLCIMFAITGTDYVEGFKNIASAKMWTALKTGGWKLIGGDNKAILIPFDYRGMNLEYRITLGENFWVDFMKYIYSIEICGVQQKTHITDIKDLTELKQIAERKNSKRWKESVPSVDYVYAVLRRCWWQVNYWANSPKGFIIDPFAIDPKTGLPLHGWKKVVKMNEYAMKCTEVERTLLVARN